MSEEELIAGRRKSIEIWQKNGFEPYSNKTFTTTSIGDIVLNPNAFVDKAVCTRGRIMSLRKMGNARFLDLVDLDSKIQLFVSKKDVKNWTIFDGIEIGDIVAVDGNVMFTKVGELTIKVSEIHPLTKCLIPPAKNGASGINDIELKYRHRYQDLIENDESKKVFKTRSLLLKKIRDYMHENDFMEVETPTLTNLRSGANAKPFTTHHNALDKDLYLRVAPELYLKRLVVGGFNKVFELGKLFRNEGTSTRHNPEFTAIEFYEAYTTCNDIMTRTEDMLTYIMRDNKIQWDEENSSFSLNFRRIPMIEAVKKALSYQLNFSLSHWDVLGGQSSTDTILYNLILISNENQRSHLRKATNLTNGSFLYLLFEVFAEPLLTTLYRDTDNTKSSPVFITDYPIEVSPLARKHNEESQTLKGICLTDRFELFIDGKEIANAFSELNDPDDQAERFQNQLNNKENGDQEYMDYDKDYIRALMVGMPPTSGFGMGIDRLVMLITNQASIRDVILFPAMR